MHHFPEVSYMVRRYQVYVKVGASIFGVIFLTSFLIGFHYRFFGNSSLTPEHRSLSSDLILNEETNDNGFTHYQSKIASKDDIIVKEPSDQIFVKTSSFTGARARNSLKQLRIRSTTPNKGPSLAELKRLFAPVMNQNEHRMYVNTLRACLKIMENAGTSYFLYGGSLIGWYRHGQKVVPWDDDIDIALLPTIEAAQRNLTYYRQILQQAADEPEFQSNFGDFKFAEQDDIKLKCYSTNPNDSTLIEDIEWRWPFIDIHFMHIYSESTWKRVFHPLTTTLKDVLVEDPRESQFSYPLGWVFPLNRGTFEGVDVFLPRQVHKILKLNYDLRLCEAQWYDHRSEVIKVNWKKVIRVNCSLLTNFVKFTNLDSIYSVVQ